jgi:hypothetical protein
MLRPVLTMAAIVSTIVVNFLAARLVTNGMTIPKISNGILGGVLITPANYAFIIWGLIYLGLLSFGVYQLLPDQRDNPRLVRSGYGIAIACLFQDAWVFLFQSLQFWPSSVVFLGILLPLLWVYRRLGIGQVRVGRRERWFVDYPISLYTAWISVATIVSISGSLYMSGLREGAAGWTVLMLTIAAGLGAMLIQQRRDWVFSWVLMWAFVAIAIRHGSAQPWVTGVALLLTLGLWLLMAGQTRNSRRIDR